MARTRSIKPEFWNDEKLATVSRDARLTFIGMWTASDDYGIVRANPRWLMNQIYPHETIQLRIFTKWLKELEMLNRILPFEVNGEHYYLIANFLKHQRIDHPAQARNPQPPTNIRETFESVSGDNRSETELKQNLIKTETILSGKPDDTSKIPYKEIIDDLNSQTGRNFRTSETNKRLIKNLWNQDYSIHAFRYVHRIKTLKWKTDPKMSDYLRPSTLYRSSNFESYLNEDFKDGDNGKKLKYFDRQDLEEQKTKARTPRSETTKKGQR